MPVSFKSFPLRVLQGLSLNGYSLHLGEIKQLRLSGWKGFKLYLQSPGGLLSILPLVKGIYSLGGKDGVKPWMDLDYREELEFEDSKGNKSKISLSSNRMDQALFKRLGDIIPPGGHFMVSYEGEQKIHRDTIKSLSIRVPPAATPLGFLIFQAGFQFIKDWYLAEGGFEGPRKLWGEKAPDDAWAQDFFQKTAQEIKEFLEKKPAPPLKELEAAARQRAKEILTFINT